MCAIFGFIARKTNRLPMETVAKIATANVGRGPHAFGFAWVTADGRIRSYKQTGRITDHLGTLAMARDAVAFVGHVRWATHGSPKNNLNNHPHPCDGGWLVHNGVVQNYDRLLHEHELSPVSECDSEAIALLVEAEAGNLLDRTTQAVDCCRGDLAVMALWARPARLIVARAGNPLHIISTDQGKFMATMPDALPASDVYVFKNHTACEFRRDDKGAIHARVQEIAARESDPFSRLCSGKTKAGSGRGEQGYHGG